MDALTFVRRLKHALAQTDFGSVRLSPSVLSARLQDLLASWRGADGFAPVEDQRLIDAIVHDVLVYGPLWRLMFDAEVSEIMVNSPSEVFVERRGVKQPAGGMAFASADQLRATVERLLQADPTARLDASKPWVDFALPDGSRVSIVMPPIVVGGVHLTVRKHLGGFRTLDDFVHRGTMDDRIAGVLAAATLSRRNVLFSGATGTGKTTIVEVLSRLIPHRERVVCIEDTLELHLDHPNLVRMLTREANLEGAGRVTIGDLFRTSLRMCPDRVLLGEIRGPEAFDYLQALNSGHDGSMAVLHASSPEEATTRLENLVSLAGLSLPIDTVRQQIAHGLDLIVQVAQLADGSRRVVRVTEVRGLRDDGLADLVDLYHLTQVDFGDGPRWAHTATGEQPAFLDALVRTGVGVQAGWFDAS